MKLVVSVKRYSHEEKVRFSWVQYALEIRKSIEMVSLPAASSTDKV